MHRRSPLREERRKDGGDFDHGASISEIRRYQRAPVTDGRLVSIPLAAFLAADSQSLGSWQRQAS